jgi:tRNA(Ser,Leu) C12 N-acetylase TAN1
MLEWNVVVSIRERGLRRAFEVLEKFGTVRKTGFFNVLVMEVNDIPGMLETLREHSSADPHYLSFLSRLIPVSEAFSFQSAEEFRNRAKEIVLAWAPGLSGRSFYVRIYRRGFKGRISSPEEEKFLDGIILESLGSAQTPGRITFEDPDAVIVIETVAQQAGLALWTREDMRKYSFIRVS